MSQELSVNSQPVVLASDQSAISTTIAANSSVNVNQVAGTTTSVNNGTVDAGTQRVTIASNSTGVIASITTSITPGTAAANLGKAEDAAHTTGDTGIAIWGVRNDNSTTVFGANGDYTPISVDDTGCLHSVGDVSHDTADSTGAPVKIGGQARTTNPTAVADGDRVNGTFDNNGRQIVIPYNVRARVVPANITLSTTTETTLVAAGGAGVFRDLMFVSCANNSATNTTVDFRDSTGTGIEFSIRVPANNTINFRLPVPHPQDVANNPWTAQLGTAVTDVDIYGLFVENN
jgi:hypothetical protein